MAFNFGQNSSFVGVENFCFLLIIGSCPMILHGLKGHFKSFNISRLRICYVNRKIMGGTAAPGPFSKWPPRKNAEYKNGNFHISTHNYHRITIFISTYMFLRVPNAMKQLLNSLLNIKRVKYLRWLPILPQIHHLPRQKYFCILLIISSCSMIQHGLSVIFDLITTYID